MPLPAVSVVMPAYNHERFVGDSIASVVNQTFENFELVIVDDGSTDDTAEVIRSFSDPRIHYHHQHNQDAFNALNNGVALSRGRYLSIINSDDLYEPTRLQVLHDTCERGAQFVFTDVEPIDDHSKSLINTPHPWNEWHRSNREFYFAGRDLYRGFLHGNYMVTTSNIFMTRELFDTVGGFAPIRYLHDYDYLFRLLLAAQSRTRYLDDQRLLKYRIHAGNTLGEAAIVGREQDREIIRKYLLARLPEETRSCAETGIDRLIALEHELIQVKRQMARQNEPKPTHSPTPTITRRVLSRLKRSLQHGG